MCACVRACYRACLVLSDPGEIGALASASIVLCILKGHWGVGGVEMRLPLVPSGPDFTPWSTSASPLQIWPDWELVSILAGSGCVEGDGAQQQRRLLMGLVKFGLLSQVTQEDPPWCHVLFSIGSVDEPYSVILWWCWCSIDMTKSPKLGSEPNYVVEPEQRARMQRSPSSSNISSEWAVLACIWSIDVTHSSRLHATNFKSFHKCLRKKTRKCWWSQRETGGWALTVCDELIRHCLIACRSLLCIRVHGFHR